MIARPHALPVNFGGIPDDIRAHPDWVLWGYIFEDGVWKKMPFTTSIKRASTSDPTTWASFDDVWDFAMLNPDYGIGIVLTQNIDGIDLDDCRDVATGELTEIANKTLTEVDGYAEVSPSGTGIKLFTISNLAASSQVKGVKDNLGDQETQIDIELYKHNTGRFFTVTGHALNGHNALPMFEQDVGWLVEMTGAKNEASDNTDDGLLNLKAPIEGWDADRIREEITPYLDQSMHYNDWLKVGQALHHQYGGDDEGLELWHEMFEHSPKKNSNRDFEDKKWKSFNNKKSTGVVTLGWIIKTTKSAREDAQEQQKRDAVELSKKLIEDCTDDMALRTKVAKVIFQDKHLDVNQKEILVATWNVKHKALTGAKLPTKTVRELLGVNSQVVPTGGSSNAPAWVKPWVYVTDVDKFLNLESKQEVTSKGFKGMYNRYMPTNFFGVREQADLFALEEWRIPVAAHKSYMPACGSMFTLFGKLWVNLYRVGSEPEMPAQLSAENLEAIELVKTHFTKYIRNERERGIFMSWVAHNVQRPGLKIRWTPYLHGPPGDGKSFFGELLGHCMGGQNVRSLNGSTLESNFTDWAMGYALTTIEEMKQHGHNRFDVMNRLKPFITNTEVEIHPKGKPSYVAPNSTNYLVLSNYLDGAPVEDEDRRFMFISSSIGLAEVKRMTDEGYYKKIFIAIQNNAGALRQWFLSYALHEEFKADGRAPHTATKDTVVEMSKSELDILTEELIEGGAVGVHKQVVSSQHLSRALRAKTEEPFQTTRVNRMLTAKGFRFLTRKWWNGEACRVWTLQGEDLSVDEAIKLLDSTTGMDFLGA